MKLTHIDEKNYPKMVDVGDKDITTRIALASGKIHMSKLAYEMIKQNQAKKGPVLQTAIIAAVMGAKKTSDLIPMCHPLNLSGIKCFIDEFSFGYKLSVEVKLDGKTGVEMEALTAVSIGLLTIYDMIKAVDKTMQITDIKLIQKQGGKSGVFVRE